MSRKPDHDLTEFQEWLEEDRLVQPATSRSYAAVVSATLTSLGEQVNQESIDALFDLRRGRSSYANYLTGWKAFVQYAFERGVSLPMPVKKKVLTEVKSLPQEGLLLAVCLRESKLSPASLRALTWSHVLSSSTRPGKTVDVIDPYRPAIRVAVSEVLVGAWRDLRGGEGCEELPLFAEAKGSTVRYPTKLLIRQVKAYQQESRKKTEVFVPRLSGAAVTPEELNAVISRRELGVATGPALPQEALDDWKSQQELPAAPEVPDSPTNLPTSTLQDIMEGRLTLEEVRSQTAAKGEVEPVLALDSADVLVLSKKAEEGVEESPSCSICGYPYEIHAAAFGLTDGSISNCAVENGYDEDTCSMCEVGCFGRHDFVAKS